MELDTPLISSFSLDIETYEFSGIHNKALEKIKNKLGKVVFDLSMKILTSNGIFVFNGNNLTINFINRRFLCSRDLYYIFYEIVPVKILDEFYRHPSENEDEVLKVISGLFYRSILSIIEWKYFKTIFSEDYGKVFYLIAKFYLSFTDELKKGNNKTKLISEFYCFNRCTCNFDENDYNDISRHFYSDFNIGRRCNICFKQNSLINFGFQFYETFRNLMNN